MAVYPDSIVDKFVVNDGHVANPISSFQVRGVYPSYFVASVCGETCCGDHVAFGVPGTRPLTITAGFLVGDGHYVGGTGVQFGTPRPTFSKVVNGVPSAQSFGTPKLNVVRSAGGVPSAQQFGVPTAKAVFVRTVGSVASAGAFGAVTAAVLSPPQTKAVVGPGSAQAFGTLTVKSPITRSVGSVPSVSAFGTVLFRVTAPTGGVSSAQQFGVPTAKAVVSRSVAGVGSAQSFGTITLRVTAPTGGVPSAGAFGVPAPKAVITRTVGSVSSGGAFGTVAAKATFLRSVTGLGSVQSFGTLTFRVSAPTGGVNSAQSFGVPVAKATFLRTVGSVASAQSFGTVVAKPGTFTRTVTGLGSAQAFGVPLPQAAGKTSVGGVPPSAAFGAPTVKAGPVTRSLVGLGSAQNFGTLSFRLARPTGGVPSSQAFGVPTVVSLAFPQTKTASGLGTAQAFGVPTASVTAIGSQRVAVQGVRGSSAYADTIVDQFKVDDGHLVNADSSSSYFGAPWVGHLWLLDPDCIDSSNPAICGDICGLEICGGISFIEDDTCLSSPFPTIVNEFTCGQRVVGGVPFQTLSESVDLTLLALEEVDGSFLFSSYDTPIVNQFVVDDGHVVDGRDACLHSPLPAICDPGTICGTVVCGGTSFISDLDCLTSLTPPIVNTFLCGTLPVSGWAFTAPITVTRTIDLQPAGCL